MSTVRVVIVDDHPFYREGVKSMAPLIDPGIEIIGEAASGIEALQVASALIPDVIVMDLAMPGMTGVEATRAITAALPGVRVLVLTMLDDDSVLAALAAGASGYLLKDASVEEVCRAIRSVAQGEMVVASGVAGRVLHRLAHEPSGDRPFPELTAREHDVLDRLARGLSTDQIARQLFLTPKTVRNYLSTVFTKLQVTSREDAARLARAAGLGK